MTHKALPLLAFLLLTSPAWAQRKQDKVTRKDGKVHVGRITEDSFKQVRITGATIRANEVAAVEYFDAPPSFTLALADIREEKWVDALSRLKTAWQRVKEEKRARKRLDCRPWFTPYHHYYTGLCERNLGRFDAALETLAKVRDKTVKTSRFWEGSFELSLECHREKKDRDGMDKLIQNISTAPPELQSLLRNRGRRQQAELCFDGEEFRKALELFRKLQSDRDEEIRGVAQVGIIRCLVKMDRASELEQYCRQVISGERSPVTLKLIASNALGASKINEKQYREALRHYSESVVFHVPPRGSGYGRDHEDALFQLASCYAKLAGEASETRAKKYFLTAAARTFRQLERTYPSGGRREEAASRAGRLETRASRVE